MNYYRNVLLTDFDDFVIRSWRQMDDTEYLAQSIFHQRPVKGTHGAPLKRQHKCKAGDSVSIGACACEETP